MTFKRIPDLADP